MMTEYKSAPAPFRPFAFVGIFLSLILISCAGLSPYYEEGGKKDSRTMAEKDFNPMSFPGDNEIVPTDSNEASMSADAVLGNYRLVEDSTANVAAPDNYVYRVQVFTSRFLQEAEVARDELYGKLGETVYLDFEAPYYKVRVGDFQTAEEGEEYLNKVRELGYTEVWLVKVKQDKTP